MLVIECEDVSVGESIWATLVTDNYALRACDSECLLHLLYHISRHPSISDSKAWFGVSYDHTKCHEKKAVQVLRDLDPELWDHLHSD